MSERIKYFIFGILATIAFMMVCVYATTDKTPPEAEKRTFDIYTQPPKRAQSPEQ